MLALFCIFASIASPDIAPDPLHRKGENLAPCVATKVALLAETVTVTIEEDTAVVRAVFTLLNTSDRAEAMDVGFPNSARPAAFSTSGKGLDVHGWDANLLQEFKARVDDVPVTPEVKRGHEDEHHWYHAWLCKAEASEWARRAINRWQEVRTWATSQGAHSHWSQKILRLGVDDIDWSIDACHEWLMATGATGRR